MSVPLSLFAGYGIELEYMIADRNTLAVRPIADQVFQTVAGNLSGEHEDGEAAWSNELVAHVIEFKTNGPAASLGPLPELFGKQVKQVNALLEPLNAMLMPTGMHPWFDPNSETKLWEHEYSVVYETYNRIFGCKGHGWSNLQSMHINLPFANDAEFMKLHAAIRLVLPILPAIAASSPMMDGELTGMADTRLETYRFNSAKIPSMTGAVIPEPVYSQAEYHEKIFEKIWADLKPHDPEGHLRHEFANSRGAIARFDRMAIEIRVIDVQECALADIAVASLATGLVRVLTEQRWQTTDQQCAWATEPLASIFLECVKKGEDAIITDGHYLRALGVNASTMSAGALWKYLSKQLEFASPALKTAALQVLEHGTLSSRIRRAVHGNTSRPHVSRVYGNLCDCLAENRLYLP